MKNPFTIKSSSDTIHFVQIGGIHLSLEQSGFNEFAVVYGLDRKEKLSYTEAAKEYGECLMHALGCQGVLELEE